MIQPYLIFSYIMDNRQYIEAYPTHGNNTDVLDAFTALNLNFEIRDFPSRNQAYKAAYQKYIRSDGIGFNQWPNRFQVKNK